MSCGNKTLADGSVGSVPSFQRNKKPSFGVVFRLIAGKQMVAVPAAAKEICCFCFHVSVTRMVKSPDVIPAVHFGKFAFSESAVVRLLRALASLLEYDMYNIIFYGFQIPFNPGSY